MEGQRWSDVLWKEGVVLLESRAEEKDPVEREVAEKGG